MQEIEQPMLVEEAKVGCIAAMLLCLERKQRLVYILSCIFEVPHAVGAELVEITNANYRKLLSRGREKLHNFMNNQCSLVAAERSCKCRNKVHGFISNHWIDPNHYVFYNGKQQTVKQTLHKKLNDFDEKYYQPYMELYQEHPMYEPPDLTTWLKKILKQEEFQELFHLN